MKKLGLKFKTQQVPQRVSSITVWILVLALVPQFLWSKPRQEPRRLVPDAVVTGELKGTQIHSYLVSPQAGQWLSLVASSQDVEIVLHLFAPDEKLILEATLSSAVEPVQTIVETMGSYRLTLQAKRGEGRYELKLAELRAATPVDRVRLAERAFKEGARLRALGTSEDLRSAIGKYEEGLRFRQPLGDARGAAYTLNLLGTIFSDLGEKTEALNRFAQALQLAQTSKDQNGQATSLASSGVVQGELGQYQSAFASLRQALTLWQALNDKRREADTWLNLGALYRNVSERQEALTCFRAALKLRQELNDRSGQETALINLGAVLLELNDKARALESFQQAINLWSANELPGAAASALNNIGVVYSTLGEKAQALEFFERALALRQSLPDASATATTLHNIGVIHSDLDDKRRALDYLEKARVLRSQSNDQRGLAATLNSLGVVYSSLGQKQRALEQYEQSLPLRRAMGDKGGEAYTLNNIGAIHSAAGEKQAATERFTQALTLWRTTGDRAGQARALTNLGAVRSDAGERQKALELFGQALVLWRAAGDRAGEAYTLNNLGFLYSLSGDKQKALDHLGRALAIFRELQSLEGTGAALHYLMLTWKSLNNPSLAILYGKLGVNAYQEIRTRLQGGEKLLPQSFLKSKEDIYRELAELLVAEGRLPEAQQVLRMLKEEEYYEFIRRNDDGTKTTRTTLTPRESELEKRYREMDDRIVLLGKERGELRAKKLRTAAEEQHLTQLEADLERANQSFQKFLDTLSAELQKLGQKDEKFRESQGLMEDLREMGTGTVALYTIVGAEKYRVIVSTPDVQVARESNLKAADLNQKIAAFRAVLRDPRRDPLPLAQELYRLLIGPIRRDLENSGAKTLMWSLDGALRYVPLAALHDGEKYLVERYQNVVITLASLARLKDAPQPKWKGLGLGVSQAKPGFPALTAVPDELHSIIQEAGNAQSGVMTGKVMLNEAFTESSWRQELRQRYSLVHIASHFKFEPGNETDSFLLLGDGNYLTLAQLKAWPNSFGGVDLLTLSACDTALGSSGTNGNEIESLGVIAQKQGAKAVLASLWPVADVSTQMLMQTFYRFRETHSETPKAEALRQAQLALLQGSTTGAMVVRAGNRGVKSSAEHLFQVNPQAPYAHPFFWAPFILIGNWK